MGRRLKNEVLQQAKEDANRKKIEELVPLIVKLKGERSIKEMAEDTKVSAAYISGILKYKRLPSIDILKKLSDDGSNPQNGISSKDLITVLGGSDLTNDKPIIIEMNSVNCGYADRINRYSELLYTKSDKFNELCKGIICKTLFEGCKKFTNKQDQEDNQIFNLAPELTILVEEAVVSEWLFFFTKIRNNIMSSELAFRMNLNKLMLVEPNPKRKFSIVVDNENFFKEISKYSGRISFRGELSLILIDTNNYLVLDEVYLSNFDLNNKESEFYIINK